MTTCQYGHVWYEQSIRNVGKEKIKKIYWCMYWQQQRQDTGKNKHGNLCVHFSHGGKLHVSRMQYYLPSQMNKYLDELEETAGQATIQEWSDYFRTIHTNRSPSFKNVNHLY
jgi:hypothetical protein